jgi:GT2 family glycosyltransferase
LTTTASIVIPTRGRPGYLEVALTSIADAARAAQVDVVVVDDAGFSPDRQGAAQQLGANYVAHPHPMGLNHARNTGVGACTGELVIFVDDDVEVTPGWLAALLDAATAHPDVPVFTGPVVPRLEGRPPRSCGREGPPITALDLGPIDVDADFAWGANMAIRRRVLARVGPFDVTLHDGGDEQEWQERMRLIEGGRVLYVAAAALYHRRAPRDARLRALARTAWTRGRAARRFDATRGPAPSPRNEVATLVRCIGHVVLRRCPAGVTLVAHSSGRLFEALRENRGRTGKIAQVPVSRIAVAAKGGAGDDFLSGEGGTVAGFDRTRRQALDGLLDAAAVLTGQTRRLRHGARAYPERRRVLVLGPVMPKRQSMAAAARSELLQSRHDVHIHTRDPAGAGKFEVLNELYNQHGTPPPDWLIAIDDDVVLPAGFLDGFLFLAERFALDLAQPAQRLASNAAWSVTRRHARSLVRETQFVEIGPVTAFARRTIPVLLPFPPLRMGWGLDTHWAAIARTHGWRCGVVDGASVRHDASPVAETYSRAAAVAEAREFLAGRPYLPATELKRTLVTHRRW